MGGVANPLMAPDPMVAAFLRASQGDSSAMPMPAPDAMPSPSAATMPTGAVDPFQAAARQLSSLPSDQLAKEITAQDTIRQTMAQKQAEMEQLRQNMPPMGYHPAAVHGFFPNLWRDLKLAAASTGPGQMVQSAIYGPGIRSYEASRQNLADQIAALQRQAEPAGEAERAITGGAQAAALGAYRGGELGVQQKKAEIAQQKADTYAQSVQNHLRLGLKSLDIRQLLAGSQIELNKARQILDTVMAQTLPQRVELGYYGVDANNSTRQAVANMESQLGIQKQHPLLNMLDSMLGTGLTPGAPETPAGAQPERGPSPVPKRPQKKPAAGKTVGDTVNF